MSVPAVTVLMPVYNGEKHLAEAIESILNQTFTDFEFLIINDGSTDTSERIIAGYTDKRIRYVKNETNLKLIATLNKGIELAYGGYIVRMDADDISMPERLQVQFDFMEQHPDVALCGSWFQIFGDKNETVKYLGNHKQIMMKMLYQCHFCHPSAIMRKAMIETFAIKFDPGFIHAEDYEFFVRIGEKFKLANIQQILLRYRFHEGSVSLQNSGTQSGNSTIIKKRLFKNIGVIVGEPELELYKSIEQFEYSKTYDYLTRAEGLLRNMLEANRRSGYFEKKFFENYLSELWFNVAYNSTSLGLKAFKKYRSSILSSVNGPGVVLLFKFWIKALLKF